MNSDSNRLAVVTTGIDTEKILVVPLILTGTGEEMEQP